MRLVLLTVVAVLTGVAAIVLLGNRGVVACSTPRTTLRTRPGLSATSAWIRPGTSWLCRVTASRSWGARVCVYATKVGMSGLALSDRGTHRRPGPLRSPVAVPDGRGVGSVGRDRSFPWLRGAHPGELQRRRGQRCRYPLTERPRLCPKTMSVSGDPFPFPTTGFSGIYSST